MCAYAYARKEKRIILTETKGFSGTYSAFKKTQGRFSSNASAFWMERKGVFLRTKTKGNTTRKWA